MNVQETAAVVAYLSAAWPAIPVAKETVQVWHEQMRHVDPDAGLAAARRIVATEDRFPSIGRFLATVEAMKRRPTYIEQHARELEAPKASTEQAMGAIGEARRALAAARPREIEQ